jgi:iron complex transport system substrate-binding protein
MGGWTIALAVLVGGWLALAATPAFAPAFAQPARIVSLNLCTDQLTLALADRARIASLSYLVADPALSVSTTEAADLRLNHGRSEEILPLEPDLVIVGRNATRPTVRLLRRLGYTLVELDMTHSLADVRERIRQLGHRLGDDDRAEALIQAFDARLAAAGAPSPGRRPTALYLQPNGYTAGRGTLIGDIIEHAGFENLGARLAVEGHGQLSLEALLVTAPDVIITDDTTPRTPALAYETLRHPAIAALTADAERVTVPLRYWICGLPETLRAVEILAEARRRVVAEAPR